MIFNMGLTHLGLETSISLMFFNSFSDIQNHNKTLENFKEFHLNWIILDKDYLINFNNFEENCHMACPMKEKFNEKTILNYNLF